MTNFARIAAASVLFLVSVAAVGDVVVLKGGVVVQLSRPPVRQGRNVLLTRMDGTLFSVAASEIDAAATTAARNAAPPPTPAVAAPPATLVEAARATREVPKARVRITDADVSHGEAAARPATDAAEAAQKEAAAAAGSGRVEVADYTQEKSGEAIVVRGALRNPGGTPAINVRMSVTAVDAKGEVIAAGEAGISSSVIDPAGSVNFSVTIPVGSRVVGSLRFAPRWVSPAPPAAPVPPGAADPATRPAASPAPAGADASRSAPPPPAPTPFGRGTLYAAPAPSAPSEPPADGKSGYLPGASHPGNQPKPPSR